MAKTFGQLTDEVLGYLRSFVRDQELSTHLTTGIGDADLVLDIASAATVSRGRCQIDDELIWVDTVDRDANTAVIPPYGRGMDGTTAVVHAAGTRVIVSPLYPRKMIKDVINQSIGAIGGMLYGVTQEVLTPSETFGYELPATTRSVLSVQVTTTDGLGAIGYLRDWTLDKHAPPAMSTTGKALYLNDGRLQAPEQLIVTCAVDPVQLVNDADDFATTLLPATSFDVVVLLSASRLLATAEAYNLQTRAIEANAMDARVPPGQGVSQSKYLYALYQERMDQERLLLLNTTANRAHYSR